MATTTITPLHIGKGRTVATALGLTVNYIENPDKTDGGQWVTAYECDPLIADSEFLFSKRQYAAVTGRDQGERDVIAYHLRISFKPGETDAETANRIGYDLAMKLTHGNHAFVCCTHVDKAHTHSHIVINSTSLDCTRKFHNFKSSAFAIRKIADHLCIENGLSIVENPKPSRGKGYGKWLGDAKPQTNREKLEHMIDAALQDAKDYDAFIAAMIAAGCEVKQGKNLSIKIPGAERFIRCKSLGEDYSAQAIVERLAGLRKVASAPFVAFVITSQTKFSLLIDIQQKIQEGKGEAYENWAKIYNLKQVAKTLIFLQENGIDSYAELAEKAGAVSADYNNRLTKIKAAENRMAEIAQLQKHIGTYGKTRDTYVRYKASKFSQDFYDTHAGDIILHKAAKKYFDELGLKKLPPMNQLKQEYATLSAEKNALYRDYKKFSAQRKELLTAKDNCERLLGIIRNAPAHNADRTQKRSHSHEI